MADNVQGRRYNRGFWPTDGDPNAGVFPTVVTMERGEESLTMTEHPVDSNGVRTDHVYLAPIRVSMSFAIGPPDGSTFADVWNQLSNWFSSATLMTVQTGKRLYTDMLIAALSNTTTEETENVLWIDIGFQQIKTVALVTGVIPPKPRQRMPKKTEPTKAQGQKQVIPEPPKQQSGMSNFFFGGG